MDTEFKNENAPAGVESWDADSWKGANDVYEHNREYVQKKLLNVDVYKSTIRIAQSGSYFVDGKEVCALPSGKIAEMQEGTRFYSEEFSVNGIPTLEEETVTKVECDDCLNVALRLKREGYNVAVLNLADLYNPGGLVLYGSRAQEESLFRRTNLFQSLYQFVGFGKKYGVPVSKEHHYPMNDNFGGIYTPNAFVFRRSCDDGYRLIEAVEMSFISVAAVDYPELTSDNRLADRYVGQTKNKIRTILRIGLDNGHDALVLGAFGCGAFRNPPEHMAQLFREVIDEPEFRNKFRLLDFAIFDDHNARHNPHNPHGNFQPFWVVFEWGKEEIKDLEMPPYLKTKVHGQTATLVDMLIELNKEKHFKSVDEALETLFKYIENIRLHGDVIAFCCSWRSIHCTTDKWFIDGHLDAERLRNALVEKNDYLTGIEAVYKDYVIDKTVKIIAMLNELQHYENPERIIRNDFLDVIGGLNDCGPNPEDYYFSFAPYVTRFFRRYVNQFWSEFAPNGTLDNALFRDFMIERHERGIKKYGLEAVIRRNYKASPCHSEVFSPYRGGAGPVYVETIDKQNRRRYVKSCGEGLGPSADPLYFEKMLLEKFKRNVGH